MFLKKPVTTATLGAAFLGAALMAAAPAPASAEVDIKTPWANIYVGPDGLYVNGPWGRVEVPASDRARVCKEWRENVEKFYDERKCKVEFDAKGCTIENVECEH